MSDPFDPLERAARYHYIADTLGNPRDAEAVRGYAEELVRNVRESASQYECSEPGR